MFSVPENTCQGASPWTPRRRTERRNQEAVEAATARTKRKI